MKVEAIFDMQCEHGEGPLWDPVDNKLYLLKGDYVKGSFNTGAVIGMPEPRFKG